MMLGINRRTVTRYWDMVADDYEINASSIWPTKKPSANMR